jgi:hypothetical protein
MTTRLLVAALLLGSLLTVSCARVAPYEREYLADPIMQIDPDPEENTLRQHVINAREGSLGGYGGGGGGCGCN